MEGNMKKAYETPVLLTESVVFGVFGCYNEEPKRLIGRQGPKIDKWIKRAKHGR
jgi:hypothetical protein